MHSGDLHRRDGWIEVDAHGSVRHVDSIQQLMRSTAVNHRHFLASNRTAYRAVLSEYGLVEGAAYTPWRTGLLFIVVLATLGLSIFSIVYKTAR